MKSLTKLAKLSSLALLTISAILISAIYLGICNPPLALTTATDKSAYYIREKVTTLGNVTRDGSPVASALVVLELHSQNDVTMAYRTVTIGNPNETWILDITDIAVWDESLANRLNTVKVGEKVKFSASVTNPYLTQRDNVYVTISVFDGNLMPLRPYISLNNSILPESTTTIYTDPIQIPSWTYSGLATIYVNVYDNIPSKGGIPYTPEKSAQFWFSRTEQGWFSGSSTASTYTTSQTSGAYSLALGLPPTLTPGTYSIYSTARYREGMAIYRTATSTTFNVLYTPIPPTASFMWLPPQPYPNMTVTFDASSSSAEGYNDTITRYEWNWGDGTPRDITTTPIITHKFMQSRQYIVTLNVTDKEGLWSTTQKPITIKPTNPTAAFTWAPTIARINKAVTFDASTSLPGWSIKTASPAPIAQYVWNFGDGTGNFTVPTPILDHTYTVSGNFTVLLEVIDTANQRNSVTHKVQVLPETPHPWDINNDSKCDIKDIAIVAKAFGSQPGDPNWNPYADITGPTPLVPDGRVDVRDVALVAKHFGEIY